MSNQENNKNWLSVLLTGFGVPANWAKVIAGAIIGALAAAGVLTQSGCGHTVTVNPDGSTTVTREGWSITVSQVQDETDAEPKVIKAELK